jgi:ABC-type transporter MlaC component
VNKTILSLITSFFLCISLANAEQPTNAVNGPDNTVLQFFNASRNGDVEQMRELISGSFYNRRKAVLENNDTYPAFLVDHFRGTTTNIEKSTIDHKNQVAVITVTTHFPDQSINTSTLVLKKDGNGAWKIVDEK